jgi:hypothetical protein
MYQAFDLRVKTNTTGHVNCRMTMNLEHVYNFCMKYFLCVNNYMHCECAKL